MSDQGSLFDMPVLSREGRTVLDAEAGERLKQDAIRQVRINADEHWSTYALGAVRIVAKSKREFTTDDVWEALEGFISTHDPRAMGAVMTDAARAGICRKTDRVQASERKECHRRPIAIWVSNICPK